MGGGRDGCHFGVWYCKRWMNETAELNYGYEGGMDGGSWRIGGKGSGMWWRWSGVSERVSVGCPTGLLSAYSVVRSI